MNEEEVTTTNEGTGYSVVWLPNGAVLFSPDTPPQHIVEPTLHNYMHHNYFREWMRGLEQETELKRFYKMMNDPKNSPEKMKERRVQ